MLGWTEIEANMMELDDLHRELAEIDENLMRNELHYLEKSDLLKRRKEIYEGLHPETKAGIAQAVGMNKAIGNNVSAESAPTFTEDTAKKSGLSERTIQVDLQIANNLTDKAKETIKQTDIRKTDALKLARMDADKQNKICLSNPFVSWLIGFGQAITL